METKQLKEVYFTEDGIVDGPKVTQCMGIGGFHWTQNPIELYSLVSDGEVNEDTVPYHAHFYMTREKARANWWRLTPDARARILQCTTVSFDMPPEWDEWYEQYLNARYNWTGYLDRKPDGWAFSHTELFKRWLSGSCPTEIAEFILTHESYIPHRRSWLNVA